MSYAEIEIEDGIPLPEPTGPRLRYPWDQLEVGQSFFVRGENATRQAPKRLTEKGWAFTSAAAEDRWGNKGRRIWRTA